MSGLVTLFSLSRTKIWIFIFRKWIYQRCTHLKTKMIIYPNKFESQHFLFPNVFTIIIELDWDTKSLGEKLTNESIVAIILPTNQLCLVVMVLSYNHRVLGSKPRNARVNMFYFRTTFSNKHFGIHA